MTLKEQVKEKAIDLYAKFEGSKDLAICCVNEIKKSWEEDGIRKFNEPILCWWDNVIEEIEKL